MNEFTLNRGAKPVPPDRHAPLPGAEPFSVMPRAMVNKGASKEEVSHARAR